MHACGNIYAWMHAEIYIYIDACGMEIYIYIYAWIHARDIDIYNVYCASKCTRYICNVNWANISQDIYIIYCASK